jgi:acetolactate synthase-1/3 small subunit
MRHIISILLQNEAGALSRVANLFSSRGFNIESLNVAPTSDTLVSRLTLVTVGSDEVIDQITKQLGKLIDVVSIRDLTATDHIERELALFKVRDSDDTEGDLAKLVERYGIRVLDDTGGHRTMEMIGNGPEIDRFITEAADLIDVEAVARSGAMAVSRGEPIAGTT